MEANVFSSNLKSQPVPVTENEIQFKTVEYLMIILSYCIFILTFPIAIIFCLRTATVFERIVVLRLGKIRRGGVMGPGLVFMLPCIDEYIRVDLRTRSFDVVPQEIITKDSVSIRIDAVVYYSIRNPLDCVIQISNVGVATRLLAQATLRTVVGTKYLTDLLTAKEDISKAVETILDEATQSWGVKVERVEIKQIHLPKNMQRAMAAEQEADREAQAKIAAARGELDASANLKAASDIMKTNPIALQLRYLQTLTSISIENNHTIIFPFPLEVMRRIITQLRNSLTLGSHGDGHCCSDPLCCSPPQMINKKLQTKTEQKDMAV